MKTKVRFLLFVCISLFLISSCLSDKTGDELGRIEIKETNTDTRIHFDETTIFLTKGQKINLWTYIDVSYKHWPSLSFSIDAIIKEKSQGVTRIDPFRKKLTMAEKKTVSKGITRWHFMGMNKELKIKETGLYTFKAFLTANEHEELIIHKSDIIFKVAP